MTDPFFEQAELQANDRDLSTISNLMVREDQLARALETQLALAEDLSNRLNDVRMRQLPEAMQRVGVDKFRCAETGTEAELKFECSGALGSDEEERERKLNILCEHGADEIVKTEVIAAFGKGEDIKAQALLGELSRRQLNVAMRRNIHHQTLKAWIKERMEEGATLPLSEIGLWYGQIAKIKRPRTDG
jgi:hypothetical protein